MTGNFGTEFLVPFPVIV